jgi:hypothetical protein
MSYRHLISPQWPLALPLASSVVLYWGYLVSVIYLSSGLPLTIAANPGQHCWVKHLRLPSRPLSQHRTHTHSCCLFCVSILSHTQLLSSTSLAVSAAACSLVSGPRVYCGASLDNPTVGSSLLLCSHPAAAVHCILCNAPRLPHREGWSIFSPCTTRALV